MKIKEKNYRTIWPDLDQTRVDIIDQTKLPHVFEIVQITHLAEMLHAIKSMQVRGAPLIGVAAAYGVALAMRKASDDVSLHAAADALIASRPTAVNLRWAVNRMVVCLQGVPESARANVAWREAAKMANEDAELRTRLEAFRAAQTQTARDMTVPPAL